MALVYGKENFAGTTSSVQDQQPDRSVILVLAFSAISPINIHRNYAAHIVLQSAFNCNSFAAEIAKLVELSQLLPILYDLNAIYSCTYKEFHDPADFLHYLAADKIAAVSTSLLWTTC
jgi:hypothetical protein